MLWNIIAGPIIGAVIGYVTNKIAVEMLFRPLNPIYIGKFHVPFTPGIIPKGKERLGKAIGDTVGNNLLSPSVIKETLLSDEMEKEIEKQIDLIFYNLSLDSSTVDAKKQLILGDTASEHFDTMIITVITQKISLGMKSMQLGDLVAAEVMAAVQDKVHGTMFSMFFKPSIITPITDEIKIRVDEYINVHGEEIAENFIKQEYNNILEQPISNSMVTIDTSELKHIILNIYHMFVSNYSDQFFKTLNLSKIVEDKVCAMNTIEVEKLVLSIMEKELGAVVNLGAVIGFILGLVNLL